MSPWHCPTFTSKITCCTKADGTAKKNPKPHTNVRLFLMNKCILIYNILACRLSLIPNNVGLDTKINGIECYGKMFSRAWF